MKLLAPAKLTRTLRVLGTRPDGYHEVDIEAVHLAFGDELKLTPGSHTTLVVRADAPWINPCTIPVGRDNLVVRAMELAAVSCHVELAKRIPLAGGLGGGSTDAAAVLRALGVPGRASAELGSDVVLSLSGGRVRARGRGEQVEQLDDLEATVTLLIPPFGVSTPAVYRAWDELGEPHDDELANDLLPAAFAVEPQLKELWRAARSRTGTPPSLAGSGATLVWWCSLAELGLTPTDEVAGHPALRLELANVPVWCVESRTLPRRALDAERGSCIKPGALG